MRKSRIAGALAAVTGSLGIGLFGTAPAMASAATSVTGQSVQVTPNTAGSNSQYTVSFTATTGMAQGAAGSIDLTAGSGTYFTACSSCSAIYSVQDGATAVPVASAAVSSSSSGSDANRVDLVLDLSSAGIAAGDTVRVTANQVTNPQLAGSYQMDVSTSTDTTPASSSYDITASAPASIKVNGGDTQSAQVNTAFASPLSVEVDDSYGNPVGGRTVTFTAPASGASGTFDKSNCPGDGANTASTECLTTTGGSGATLGVATASSFTANSSVGSYTVTATVATATGSASADFHLTNSAVPLSQVTPGSVTVSPDTEAASNATYTVHFTTNGALSSGDTITLTAPNLTTFPSGSCGVSLTGCTNPTVTYGSGSQTAVYVGSASASAAAGPGSTSPSSTNNRITITIGPLGTSSVPAGTPVTVKITGATNPTVASNNPAVTSGAYDIAESDQADPGAVGSNPYAIVPGPATKLVVGPGSGQTATVATPFADPLTVTAEDANSNPELQGTPVTFVLPSSQGQPEGTFPGSISQQTNQTDSFGRVTSSVITANQTAGGWMATAELFGGAAPVSFSLTNSPGAPAHMVSPTGSGQSTVVATAFTNPLAVTVHDAYGNPVPGAAVTFTAPASGAGATFASCPANPANASTNECVVDADSSGLATSSAFTADQTAGSYSISAASGNASSEFSETNTHDVPAKVVVVSGDGQNAAVNSAFADPLVAKVTDQYGNPVAGEQVTFAPPAKGPSGAFAGDPAACTANTGSTPAGECATTTDSSGQAKSSTYTADASAGPDAVTASDTGTANVAPATFNLVNQPTLVVLSGTPQSAQVGTAYANPLQVTAVDGNGTPVTGTSVVFTVASGDATFANGTGSDTETTDSSGIASAQTLTAGHAAGPVTVDAQVAGTPATKVSFSLVNTAGPAKTVAVVSGSPQSATVGTAFAAPLVAAVKDQYGNPVPGDQVTFSAPAQGASGTFASDKAVCTGNTASTPAGQCITTTDSAGEATSSTYTANGTAGKDYSITGQDTTDSTTSQLAAASFDLTNLAGAPTTLSGPTGTGQSTQVGTQYAHPLQAVVEDADGNPVANADVTFSVASGDATFPNGQKTDTEHSDSTGAVMSLAITAGHTAGPVTVTAVIPGQQASQISYSLQNTPGPATAIAVSSGSGQTAAAGTPFAAPVVATAEDQYGNPVPNVPVTFLAPTSGPGATFPGGQGSATAVTGTAGTSLGQATSPTFTANSKAGAWQMTVQLADASTVKAVATESNGAGSGAALTITSGSGQSAHVGRAFAHALAAEVTDAYGNPVPGQAVTFTMPASDPTGSFGFSGQSVTVNTDTQGVATAPTATAGLRPGAYAATASTVIGAKDDVVQFPLTNTDGYWLVGSDGSVQVFGDAGRYGSLSGVKLAQPIVGMAALPDGSGYWLVARDGGIFSFGNARFHGSTGGVKLNQPIVGMAATPDGGGYWLVASDGGIFAFGDARFHGSTGGVKLDQPIVGMAATGDGGGYWLVASDGGMFAFGDAHFYGSTGGIRLNKPVVGMAPAPDGNGYWLVASDGGIFAFGPGARFYGSTGNVALAQPIVGMTAAPGGGGYWFVAHDGGIFAFGPDAKYQGSGSGAGEPVVGMAEG